MVQFCCVIGCGNRSNRERKAFFRLPQIPKRIEKSSVKGQLIADRRAQWLQNIARVDLKDGDSSYSPGYIRICSDHFYAGKPGDLMDVDNPDWAPTLKMGQSDVRMKGPRRKKETEGVSVPESSKPRNTTRTSRNISIKTRNTSSRPKNTDRKPRSKSSKPRNVEKNATTKLHSKPRPIQTKIKKVQSPVKANTVPEMKWQARKTVHRHETRGKMAYDKMVAMKGIVRKTAMYAIRGGNKKRHMNEEKDVVVKKKRADILKEVMQRQHKRCTLVPFIHKITTDCIVHPAAAAAATIDDDDDDVQFLSERIVKIECNDTRPLAQSGDIDYLNAQSFSVNVQHEHSRQTVGESDHGNSCDTQSIYGSAVKIEYDDVPLLVENDEINDSNVKFLGENVAHKEYSGQSLDESNFENSCDIPSIRKSIVKIECDYVQPFAESGGINDSNVPSLDENFARRFLSETDFENSCAMQSVGASAVKNECDTQSLSESLVKKEYCGQSFGENDLENFCDVQSLGANAVKNEYDVQSLDKNLITNQSGDLLLNDNVNSNVKSPHECNVKRFKGWDVKSTDESSNKSLVTLLDDCFEPADECDAKSPNVIDAELQKATVVKLPDITDIKLTDVSLPDVFGVKLPDVYDLKSSNECDVQFSGECQFPGERNVQSACDDSNGHCVDSELLKEFKKEQL